MMKSKFTAIASFLLFFFFALNVTTRVTSAQTITPLPTASTAMTCGGSCNPAAPNCADGLQCAFLGGIYQCVNPSCSTSSSCICASTVPSPVDNQLPHAGISVPTTFLVLIGAVLLIGSFLLI